MPSWVWYVIALSVFGSAMTYAAVNEFLDWRDRRREAGPRHRRVGE